MNMVHIWNTSRALGGVLAVIDLAEGTHYSTEADHLVTEGKTMVVPGIISRQTWHAIISHIEHVRKCQDSVLTNSLGRILHNILYLP